METVSSKRIKSLNDGRYDYAAEEAEYAKAKQLYEMDKDEEAFKIFRRLADEQNHSESQYMCGIMYRDGIRDREYVCQATKYLEKARGNGNANAWIDLGDQHLSGKHYDLALPCYQEAANLGSGKAWLLLGTMHFNGYKGVPKNNDEALTCYKNAADKGFAGGWHGQGIVKASDTQHAKEYEQIFSYYQTSVNLGSTKGCFALGVLYQTGLGVEKSYLQALICYEKSLKNDHPGGGHLIAILYQYCIDAPKNTAIAQHYVDKAIELGSTIKTTKDYLAELKKTTFNLMEKKKYAVALPTLLLLAQTNDAEAQFQAGELYMYGYGVDQSSTEAKKHFKLAYRNPSEHLFRDVAAIMLGDIHTSGWEQWKISSTSLEWYRRVRADKVDKDNNVKVAKFLIDAGHKQDHKLIKAHLDNAIANNHPSAGQTKMNWENSLIEKSFNLNFNLNLNFDFLSPKKPVDVSRGDDDGL